jgi:hypothetical protein
MDIEKTIEESLERQARRQVLNYALYQLITDNGGEVSFPLSVMEGKDMGGMGIIVDPKAGTLTLKAINVEQMQGLEESKNCEHH